MRSALLLALTLIAQTGFCAEARHIVLVAGDEEYRSEESMPMLAKILSERHGFRCTVLYPVNPLDGTINPLITTNIPGIEALKNADLCILAIRFRTLPDSQMKYFAEYLREGKPVIGIRTSTHGFAYDQKSESRFRDYDWRSAEWSGGFGRQVLGETWIDHHGVHGQQSTRSIPNPAHKGHPILRGVGEIWGPTDVYKVDHLGSEATVLLYGQVLDGMEPSSPPVHGSKNNPMMPLVWLRDYKLPDGKPGKAMTTTIGAAVDFADEDLRRLIVNGCYWLMGMSNQIPEKADVRTVGSCVPSYFGFGKFKPGLKP